MAARTAASRPRAVVIGTDDDWCLGTIERSAVSPCGSTRLTAAALRVHTRAPEAARRAVGASVDNAANRDPSTFCDWCHDRDRLAVEAERQVADVLAEIGPPTPETRPAGRRNPD